LAAELELCWGTVRQADLAELIGVAAGAGFQAITVGTDLVAKSGLGAAELRSRLNDTGVRISNLDALISVLPGMPTPEFVDKTYGSYGTGLDVRKGFTTTEDEFYRIAEATGGDSINLVHFGGDPDTPLEAMAEAVAGVSRRAAQRGLMIVFEFLPGTAVPDIDTAGRLARMVDDPNMKIMLDSRHLARSGGTLEDVVRHAELIGATQFSDLKWADRDAENRLMPYEGDLQLEAMVAAVQRANPAVPIGIEVFSTLLYEIPAAEAAERAGGALRKLVEASEANIRAMDGI